MSELEDAYVPTDAQIEKRARDICERDGIDPDGSKPAGWDPTHDGPMWTGYVAMAREELLAEYIYSGQQ
jgi:hypothetical protein